MSHSRSRGWLAFFGVALRPREKCENDVLQPSWRASSDEIILGPTAHHPIDGRFVMVFLLFKRHRREWRVPKIDLNGDAGIIESRNLKAVAVLPIAVALGGIPF